MHISSTRSRISHRRGISLSRQSRCLSGDSRLQRRSLMAVRSEPYSIWSLVQHNPTQVVALSGLEIVYRDVGGRGLAVETDTRALPADTSWLFALGAEHDLPRRSAVDSRETALLKLCEWRRLWSTSTTRPVATTALPLLNGAGDSPSIESEASEPHRMHLTKLPHRSSPKLERRPTKRLPDTTTMCTAASRPCLCLYLCGLTIIRPRVAKSRWAHGTLDA